LQHILLASGLRVKAEVLGAISTKITAEINFSLWNRNVEIVTTNAYVWQLFVCVQVSPEDLFSLHMTNLFRYLSLQI